MAETTKKLPVSVSSKALREMEIGDKLTVDVCRKLKDALDTIAYEIQILSDNL